ncbi:MAG: acyl-CoA dehydrogenase family protein, partial [Alphaproteobacteria bacterium]|nr:acyl-CoA dehydrogenase family protein [Alphaproteobacteria bacterium]
MDFSLSEEQQLLKDSVQRFVRDEYELESRRKLVASDTGYSEENWAKMAELGWLAMPLPEEFGGIGGGS